VTADIPVLSQVADEWLHATVHAIDDRAGDQIDRKQQADFIADLQLRLQRLAPFRMTAGSVQANTSGVLIDLDTDQPGEPFAVLSHEVRTATAQVFGQDAIRRRAGPPHLSLGYATGPADSGVVQSRLRYVVRPSHAPMTVDAVYLVDVVQDVERSQYRWVPPIARIGLGRR
jgi:hypothetical protein